MGHIFVSYSHKDKNYAHKLADELHARGFDAWIDKRIDYGERWPKEIQQHLDDSDAFIVIVSENSFQSDWVQSELARAKRKGKTVFPLLLSGDPWLAVEGMQYVDVRDQSLPSERFYELLKREIDRGQQDSLPWSKPDPRPGAPAGKPRSGNRTTYIAGGIIMAGILFCICGILAVGPIRSMLSRVLDRAVTPTPTMPVATETIHHPTDPPSSPTATPLPLTPIPTMISPDWPVVVHDHFESNSNEWNVGDQDDELATWHSDIANGILLWHVIAKKGFIGRMDFAGPDVSDFLLEVDIKQLSGPPSADYGIAFRRDEAGTSHYTFRISDDAFSLKLLKDNSEWTTLIDLTPSPAIKPNQQNHLTVLGMGSHFTFYINDQYVGEIDDSQLSTGTIILVVSLDNPEDQAVFEFDNFELRAP